MKRAIIMTCFCTNGEIDAYKKRIIKSLKAYANFFVVTLNGEVSLDSMQFLKKTVSKVLVRKNIGYDAGAYKDALLNLCMEEYDELMLLNDTFFGFFYPLDELINRAKVESEVDFWGFTKHPKGKDDYNNIIEEHIQAYFLYIKSRMLHSNSFMEFWDNISYPQTYNEAIHNFEIKFTVFFEKRGFIGRSFCDLERAGIEIHYNENPYLLYPYELIRKMRCPILKRKSCSINYPSTWKTIAYIEKMQLYDVDYLFKQILYDYKIGVISAYFNLYELEKFLKKYKKIYIFGKGKYGLSFYDYLTIRHIKVEKFVVSQNDNLDDKNIITLSEMPDGEKNGIIVALKPKYKEEVIEELLRKVKVDQLFVGGKGIKEICNK